MFSSKNLKNYLKILRIKRCFCSYRKTMGMDSNMFKEEEVILYDFLSMFNFDEADSIISEKLIIDDNKDDRYKKFIFENNKDKFHYFIQGRTKNTNLHIKVENKKIKHWRLLSNLFRSTPFYYFFFDIKIFLTDKRSEQNFIIFKTEVSSLLNLLDIYCKETYGSEKQIMLSRKLIKKDLKEARIAVETFKMEVKNEVNEEKELEMENYFIGDV